jgi:hypothetical protein
MTRTTDRKRRLTVVELSAVAEAPELVAGAERYYENPLPGVRFMQLDLHWSRTLEAAGRRSRGRDRDGSW